MAPPTLSMLSNGMCFVAQHARELSHPLLLILLLVSGASLATTILEKRRGKWNGGALNGRTPLQTSGPQSEHRMAAGSKNSKKKHGQKPRNIENENARCHLVDCIPDSLQYKAFLIGCLV